MTNWQSNLRPGWRGGLRRSDIRIAVIAAAIQIGASSGAAAHGHGHGGHSCWWASSCQTPSQLDPLAYMLLALGPVALLVRRQHPRAVLAFVFAVTLVYVALGYVQGPNYVSLVFAVLAAAMAGDRIAASAGVIAGWVAFLWLPAALGTAGAPTALAALAITAWLLVLLAGAEGVRVRREQVAEARRARELRARRQADEERLRIARELHDVLAHSISLINVQSGVALHLIDKQPEQARTALAAINDASAEALREVRSVLGVLRGTGEQPPRAPTAGLARLDDLVSRAAAAGVEVSLDISGERRPLPASIDLAAFRIVQESLTNVIRHAGAAAATVTLKYETAELTVQVDDDGRGADGSRSGDAHALPMGRARPMARAPAPGKGWGAGSPGCASGRTALGGSLDAGQLADRRLPCACPPAALAGGRAMIRVLLADDQELVRAGFQALLDAQDGIEVVGSAADGREAVELARKLKPDVILMDIRMPVLDGLQATHEIASDGDARRRADRDPDHVRARRVRVRRRSVPAPPDSSSRTPSRPT